ncbi:hypothetical protein QJS10_CPB22g00582 [Acorus calamus]|uniref:CASP-like protein n=1 Tax=Acorus calamus TaxID=4465 RepID=A0AAV9C2L2_ACOCL|nr:hypothetical protein QJS10_CPB22g00582 [Acorus calamus]
MENNNIAKQDKDLSNKVQRNYVMTQVALRTLAFISTLSAALVMVTNEQHKVVLGLSWNARYTYSAAFRFLVYANSIACAYSILSLPLLVRSASKKPLLLFFLDLVVTMLLMSASSAAAAIAYVGKKGEDRMGWTAVCTFVEKFCQKAGISLVSSFTAFVIMFLITNTSAHHLRRSTVAAASTTAMISSVP